MKRQRGRRFIWSRRAVGLAVAVVAAGSAPVAASGDAGIKTQVLEVENRLYAEGRGMDQAMNPAYQREQHPWRSDEYWMDPFRRGWDGSRGESMDVRVTNRYGASLAGILFRPDLPWRDPVTGEWAEGPLPAVVIAPGLGNWSTDYVGMAQQLAEHGYVVLVIEPQGQHLSEADPDPVYCGDEGWWREPQEAGLQERGDCAGHDPQPAQDGAPDPLLAPAGRVVEDTPLGYPYMVAASMAHARRDPAGVRDSVVANYEIVRARFAFAAIDAADWLVSEANPWQRLVDPDRIGVAGHSAGADGAVVAGNSHRTGRFKAAVAWDTYGVTPAGVVPSVPTMWQQAEQQVIVGPWVPVPDPEFWHSYRERARWEAAGIDTFLVALRGSTHQEWVWFPDIYLNPDRWMTNASSEGHQVAAYYTLAWFDRWLKGRSSGVHAADARRRLTASVFDASVDRTNIGTGSYDPLRDRNMPHTLELEPVADHLSRLFRSRYAFDGIACTDLRSGC